MSPKVKYKYTNYRKKCPICKNYIHRNLSICPICFFKFNISNKKSLRSMDIKPLSFNQIGNSRESETKNE